MSDAQESYERAYAQHREAHGPHGARPEPAHQVGELLQRVVLGEPGALQRMISQVELGFLVVEILKRQIDCRGKTLERVNTEAMTEIQATARAMCVAVQGRVARVVDAAVAETAAGPRGEEGWMLVAALHAYFERWGAGCSDQEAYSRMLALWRGATT